MSSKWEGSNFTEYYLTSTSVWATRSPASIMTSFENLFATKTEFCFSRVFGLNPPFGRNYPIFSDLKFKLSTFAAIAPFDNSSNFV